MTSSGAKSVNSTKAAPDIPSSPVMNMRIGCNIADLVLFEIKLFLDIYCSFHKRDRAAEEKHTDIVTIACKISRIAVEPNRMSNNLCT